MTVRTIRFFRRASVEGAAQTVLRSAASVASDPGSRTGASVAASWAAILPSTSVTRASALFQRASSSPSTSRLARIGGVVLPEGPISCKARRFAIALECFAHLIPPLIGFFLSGNGRGNGARANHHEKRLLNGIIDPQTAKGDATRLAIIHPAAAAAVAWDVMLCARIAKRQLTPATAAAEQARQQSVAVLGCAVMAAGGNITAHHPTDRLVFLPRHIPLL